MALDHQKAVRTFETAAQTLQDPELKQFVSRTLPKLREHKQQVEQLVESKGLITTKRKHLSCDPKSARTSTGHSLTLR